MTSHTHADLDALRRTEPAPPPRGRGRGARIAVILIALGLLATTVAVLRPVLFPPPTVRTAPVLAAAVDGASPAPTGETLQDVGWLEAHPFPTTVRPLVRGVLHELLVLEGQKVVRGETVIGRLRNLEIENAYEQAKAELVVATARVERSRTAHGVAESLLGQKLDSRRVEADMEGLRDAADQEVKRLAAKHREAEAGVETARVELRAQEKLKAAGGDTPIAYDIALARLNQAREKSKAVASDVDRARADVRRYARLVEIAAEGVRDPRDLQGDVDVAAQALALAKAEEARARVSLAVAKTNFDHLIVRAPASGVVMRLESAPGAVVGPSGEYKEGEESGPGSTSRLNRMTGSLVSLYDPAQLQVRVDVLYAQVAGVTRGSTITFTVDAIPGKTFQGELDRMVHEADINQNALQMKIRVTNPDPRMRPEMLCRVQFAAKAATKALPGAPMRLGHFRVPDAAVQNGGVFVYDPTGGGRARRVAVRVISSASGYSVIEGELGISNKVILDPIEDGAAVRIHNESK